MATPGTRWRGVVAGRETMQRGRCGYIESVTDVLREGVVVVDKPGGWTSHDVVNKMRRLLGERRIGHLGTLDPLATGVLPLLVGRVTRLAQFFTENDKKYEASIRFGVVTDSYDRDGTVVSESADVRIERAELERALHAFRGTFAQTPPPVSAKKIQGKPAYQLARQKIPVELKPVEVTVHGLELVAFGDGCAAISVHCAGGTYIRSIAHEVGQALGCGATLDALRRTRSGGFEIAQAHTMAELEARAAEGTILDAMIRAADLLPQFPVERVDALTAGQIRQGRDFRVSPFRAQRDARYVKAVGEDGDLIALGEAVLPDLYHPVVVL